MAVDPTLTPCPARSALPAGACLLLLESVARQIPGQDRVRKAIFEPAHRALGDYAVFVFAAGLIAPGFSLKDEYSTRQSGIAADRE